jgi:hypothetical protein
MRDIWTQIDTFARDLLSATTLDQLAARHHAVGQEAEAMYYI